MAVGKHGQMPVVPPNKNIMSTDNIEQARERVQEIAREFAEQGDSTGWFEELYKEAAGDNEKIPWADLEPNPYFRAWAEKNELKGNDHKALVVGCGLGDDAIFLHDLGFDVTAFDISPTAIEWAKKLSGERSIAYHTADLFKPDRAWSKAFDLVLEIYTIQPLPMKIRGDVIASIADFVAENGELIVVTRGREDDEEPETLPWPMSRKDLALFETHGLKQTAFEIMPGKEEENPIDRFVAAFKREG